MNKKRYFQIFIIFSLLIACTSVAYAADDIDLDIDDTISIDDADDSVSLDDDADDDLDESDEDYLDEDEDLDYYSDDGEDSEDDDDWDDDEDYSDDEDDWEDDDDWDDDEDYSDDEDDWEDYDDWDDELDEEYFKEYELQSLKRAAKSYIIFYEKYLNNITANESYYFDQLDSFDENNTQYDDLLGFINSTKEDYYYYEYDFFKIVSQYYLKTYGNYSDDFNFTDDYLGELYDEFINLTQVYFICNYEYMCKGVSMALGAAGASAPDSDVPKDKSSDTNKNSPKDSTPKNTSFNNVSDISSNSTSQGNATDSDMSSDTPVESESNDPILMLLLVIILFVLVII